MAFGINGNGIRKGRVKIRTGERTCLATIEFCGASLIAL